MFGFLAGLITGALGVFLLSSAQLRAPQLRHVRRGWAVYTSDNQLVGHVDEVEMNDFVMWNAGPNGQDFCIPATMIREASNGRVMLGVTRDELPQRAMVQMHRAA